MMAEALRAPDSAEFDKFEAQRKALGGLLARFTADRDALISSVQECERQLADVVSRLNAGQAGEMASVSPGASPNITELVGLRRQLEELQSEQRRTATTANTTAAQMARAEAALQRMEELAQATPGDMPETTTRLAQVEAGREALLSVVRECERRVVQIATRIDEMASHATANSPEQGKVELDALRQLLDQVQSDQRHTEAELIATTEQLTSRTDQVLRRVEELVVAYQTGEARAETLIANITATQDSSTAAAQRCEQEVAAVAARLDACLADRLQEREEDRADRERQVARIDVVLQRIDQLGAIREAVDEGREERAEGRAIVDRVSAAVQRLQEQAPVERLTELAERVQSLGSQVELLHRQMLEAHPVRAELSTVRPAVAPYTTELSRELSRRTTPPRGLSPRLALVGLAVAILCGIVAVHRQELSLRLRSLGLSYTSSPQILRGDDPVGAAKPISPPRFETALNVETSFAGASVVAQNGLRASGYAPAVALGLIGVCIGSVVLLRLRKSRAPAEIASGHLAS